MPHRISLKTKLIFAFTVLGLMPLVVMGIMALQVVNATHRQDVASMEKQLLSQKIAEINKFLEDTAGLFDISVGYEQTAVISPADQKFLLDKLLESNSAIAEASFVDMLGKETAKVSRLQDSSRMPLFDVSDFPGFTAAKAGQKYFSEVHYALTGPILTLSGPVLNRNGQVIMVLSGQIDLSSVLRSINFTTLGNTGYIYLADRSGTVLASTDNKYLNYNISQNSWAANVLGGGRQEMATGPGLSGERVLLVGMPITKTGWAAVAEWPEADAFLVVKNIQYQVIGFSLFMVLGAIFLGWLAGRVLLAPLVVLQAGVIRIGTGHFEHKIQINTNDELAELGTVLNRMGDNLKRLEELKAAEIREKALAESLRKEKEVSRIKEQLIKNSSHQLRTPLSIAKWNFELLSKAKTLEDEKDLKRDLGAGLEQLNSIVRDLVTVSDLGFDFKNTLSVPVDLPSLFDKLKDKFNKRFSGKGLAWEISVTAKACQAFGHPLFLPLVFENVFENAATYSKAGGAIKVELAGDEKDIRFSIKDSGIGVPDKDKDLLFTQFFRAENAIDAQNVGTGLGLYISKTIVDGHGGKIRLESELGKGTGVYITLPINKPVPVKKAVGSFFKQI